MYGKLYLIPSPLGDNALHTLPPYVIDIVHRLDYFIVERAKTARHFIKDSGINRPIAELHIVELNDQIPESEWQTYLEPALKGQDVGLLSEAGCPGVADPGAQMVALAHQKNIEVIPLVGPSSILLALMASGMNGQSFCFQGYLSAKRGELDKDLKRIEQLAQRQGQTQLFIEVPYRNNAMLEQALQSLLPTTLLCVAADLTLPTQYIKTLSVAAWKKVKPLPDLHKRPAIFLIGKG